MKSYSQSEIERFAKIINANKSVIDKLSNVERVDAIEAFKKGNKIHIKKENRGKFTDYCGGKVTSECIQRGKNSSDPKIRKRATFAANARKWKHQSGGILEDRSAEKQKYDEWNQLPAIGKLKRNFTIAKQFISESPKAENVYNGLQITRKFNTAVKNGMTYEDGDIRHLNRGPRSYDAQTRERARIFLVKYRSGTPEFKQFDKLTKTLAKRKDSGATNSVLNNIKKQMNGILDDLIDKGYVQ